MDFSCTDEEEEAVVVEEEDLILKGSEAVVAEDLILDILLRLPPVSVVRFKCVSKSWYSLITNPSFLKNHARLLRSQRLLDPLVLMSNVRLLSSQLVHPRLPSSNYRDSTKLYVISTQDQDEPEKPHPFLKVFLDDSLADFRQKISRCFLIDSCNGLLLYHATNRNLDTRYQYIVFNPITNQYREVPIMDLLQTFEAEEAKEIYVCGFPRIVFDPSISVSYKLIACLYREKPRSNYAFYFYSADTNSWRLSTSFDDEDNSVIGRKTFMFDGVFYWLKRDVSICFDAVKENVWFLPLPPIPSDCFNRDVVYFGERNGRLRLIEEYNSLIRNDGWSFPCSFDIMEMDMGSKIWTVKSRVNFVEGYDHLIRHNIYDPFYCGFVRVVHLYETEKGEEAILLSVDYEKLVSFNLTTNTFGKEFTIPHIIDYRYLEAFSFTPTLFPLLT